MFIFELANSDSNRVYILYFINIKDGNYSNKSVNTQIFQNYNLVLFINRFSIYNVY